MTKHAVSQQRLNEIAMRHLGAMGVRVGLSSDGQTVLGELSVDGVPLLHPRTRQDLGPVRFEVQGHDQLRLLTPVLLTQLPPLRFQPEDQVATLLGRIEQQLQQRFAALRRLHDRLQTFGVAVAFDDEQLCVHGQLELVGSGTVELQACGQGLRVRSVRRHHAAAPVSLGELPLSLDEFPSRTDLELALGPHVERALQSAGRSAPPGSFTPAPTAPSAPESLMLKEIKPPAGVLTTDAIYRGLGPGFQVAPGLALRREWQLGNDNIRLDMVNLQGTSFGCSVYVNGQLRLQESLTLRDFASAEALVQKALKAPAMPSEAAPAPAGGEPLGHGSWNHSELPVAGEIWVMGIQMLEAGAAEVRYVTISRDGEPFGAPRVLPRTDFERLFVPLSQAVYRLVVRVLAVAAGQVQYQHLDAQRQPASEPRNIDMPAFVSTFLAEAAAY